LNAFLEKIELPIIKTEQVQHTQVIPEYSAGDSLGRMDIVINCKPDYLIVIENKIDAGEAEKQLPRYSKWLKKKQGYNIKKLIFLTPTGHESVTGEKDSYLQLSYLNLAEAFESKLNEIEADSVKIVLTQYITTCKFIGGVEVTSDKELLALLTKSENIQLVLEIEQQAQLIRKQVVKEFGEHIQKILQDKLDVEKFDNIWKASISFDQTFLNVEIRTLAHQAKPNYRMLGEHIFSNRNWGWSGWCRPQWIDFKSQPPETLDTKDLTTKMTSNGCDGAQSSWVGSKLLRNGKKGFVPTDIDDIVACLEDNRISDHPLANSIA
jgi:hypothetical protein